MGYDQVVWAQSLSSLIKPYYTIAHFSAYTGLTLTWPGFYARI